jgi:hypothetical protein
VNIVTEPTIHMQENEKQLPARRGKALWIIACSLRSLESRCVCRLDTEIFQGQPAETHKFLRGLSHMPMGHIRKPDRMFRYRIIQLDNPQACPGKTRTDIQLR